MDIEKIAKELDFDVEDVELILAAFLENSKTNLINLEKAIKSADFASIRSWAHAIKGGAGNILLHEIVQLANLIEKAAYEQKEILYEQEYLKLQKLIRDLGGE